MGGKGMSPSRDGLPSTFAETEREPEMTDSLFDRRTLMLTGAAVLTALPAAAQTAPLDRGPPSSAGSAKLSRVSIMAYNFTSRLKLEGQPPGPDRELEFFDLADYLADA